MEGTNLAYFVIALAVSLVAEMSAVYYMMQVLKIDASSSAVGAGGTDRKQNLQRFVALVVVGPTGAGIAFGLSTAYIGIGWLFGFSLIVLLIQLLSASYMAVNLVEPAVKSGENVTQLKRA